MKIYSLLIAFFVVAAAAFCGLWLRERGRIDVVGPVGQQVERTRDELFETPPLTTFDLQAAVSGGAGAELVDPAKSLPQFHRFSRDLVSQLRTYAESCGPVVPDGMTEANLAKALVWSRYECGELAELPTGFFEQAPLLHLGGRSYVKLALAGKRPLADPRAFAEQHIGVMHVTELGTLPAGLVDPDPVRRLLATFSRPTLAALVAKEPAVRDGDRLLFYAPSAGSLEGGGEYRVYGSSAWEALNGRLSLVARESATFCQYGTGTYCWVARASSTSGLYQALATLALAGLSLVLAVLAVTRILAQRRDREDQLFVLRTLTHELRTPATGLSLTLETLRDDFDNLSAQSQSAFLSLCDEVQRLTRVIAASARYLKVQGPRSRFEVSRLDSIREFLEAILEPFQGKISVTLPEKDGPFRTDPYWLKVCIVNLVENALKHGKPEVEVICFLKDKILEIAVKDKGSLAHADLDALAREAARREGQGLGLGLGIVLRTVKDLGGSLVLTTAPTKLLLKWKESR